MLRRKDIFELEILKRLQDSSPAHPGYRYTPRLFDSFEHVGPNGRHVCLVFEPLEESFASFGTLFLNVRCQIPSRSFSLSRFSSLWTMHMNATSSIQVSAQIVSSELSTEWGITVHRYQAPKHHGPNPPPLIHR